MREWTYHDITSVMVGTGAGVVGGQLAYALEATTVLASGIAMVTSLIGCTVYDRLAR